MILAAVIASFVFGMAGNISKTKVLAATAQQPDGNHIVITYQGGQDADTCDLVTISVTPEDEATVADTVLSQHTPAVAGEKVPVGKSVTIAAGAGNSFAGKDHVVITAHFTDGSDQVIMDNTI